MTFKKNYGDVTMPELLFCTVSQPLFSSVVFSYAMCMNIHLYSYNAFNKQYVIIIQWPFYTMYVVFGLVCIAKT